MDPYWFQSGLESGDAWAICCEITLIAKINQSLDASCIDIVLRNDAAEDLICVIESEVDGKISICLVGSRHFINHIP